MSNKLYYDYENQAWVRNEKYIRCGHPESMDCQCYGKLNEGKPMQPVKQLSKEILSAIEDAIN